MTGLVYLILLLNLIFSLFANTLLKSIVEKLPKAKSLSLQFFFAVLISLVLSFFTGGPKFGLFFLLISLVGFINSFGVYCQWRAYDFSLSKTVMYIPLIGIVASVLATVFLGEALIYKNSLAVLLGVILLFSASFFMLKESKKIHSRVGFSWMGFVLGMVVISGIATFLVKFFTFSVNLQTFLLYWYLGAFLGSLPIIWLGRGETKKLFQPLFWQIPLAALGILLSLATVYWALSLAPTGIVLSIQNLGLVLFSAIIGWLLFKERKGILKYQVVGFIIGFLGLTLLIFGR